MRHLIDLVENNDPTLYHGTLIYNIPSIQRDGIEPRVGDFVKHFYDDDELDELVFSADKNGLGKCVSAIMGYLRLRNISPTAENILRYGAICVMRGQSHNFILTGNSDEEDYEGCPRQVEPLDYYSRDVIFPDYYLVRDKLRSFLKRHVFDIAPFGIPSK